MAFPDFQSNASDYQTSDGTIRPAVAMAPLWNYPVGPAEMTIEFTNFAIDNAAGGSPRLRIIAARRAGRAKLEMK